MVGSAAAECGGCGISDPPPPAHTGRSTTDRRSVKRGYGRCAEGLARAGSRSVATASCLSDGGHPLHRSIARRAALAVVGLLVLAPAAQAATSSSRATLTK